MERTVTPKPRVGLVLVRKDWAACIQGQDVVEAIRGDAEELTARLAEDFQLIGPWVVDSAEGLQLCQRGLRETEIDLVLLTYQTSVEENMLVPILQALGTRPLVLWCYVPWRRLPRPTSFGDLQRASGPIGAFDALGTLHNLNVPFLFTYGSPEENRLIEDLKVAGRAAQIRSALRSARIGLLPDRSKHDPSTFVDSERLLADLGPQVVPLPVEAVKQAVELVSAAQTDAFLQRLRALYPVRGIGDAALFRSARLALGLEETARDRRLDVLAVNDQSPELRRTLGIRPALYPDLENARSTLYQPKSDIGAATAHFILAHLTHRPTFFFSLWAWDEAKNQMIGGQSGLQNPAMGDARRVWVGRDYEMSHRDLEGPGMEGHENATIHWVAAQGRVTLFQLRSASKGWQAVAASSMILESQMLVEGMPHALLRLDAPVAHFLQRAAQIGVTPHWVLSYGSVLSEIEAFCQMVKIPLQILND